MDRLYRYLYAKSLRLLGLRLRSEKEMRDKIAIWLKTADYSQQSDDAENNHAIIERIIEQLKKENFVNDRRFAEEWTGSRLRNGKKGPVVIKMELRNKGIDSGIIEDVLTRLYSDATFEDSDSRPVLVAAQKYLPRLKGDISAASKSKMLNFLLRRGFSTSESYSAIKELLS